MNDLASKGQDGIHYAATHSMAAKDFDVLREMILKLVRESRQLVKESAEEEVVHFSVDYFML